MDKIIVIGGGGHAKVVVSILQENSSWEILGYTDLSDRGAILGVSYLGNDSVLPELIRKFPECAIALGIGQVKITNVRRQLFESFEKEGFSFPSIVARSAVVYPGASMGKGTVVMAGVVINTGASIGQCVIINTGSSVDHDCRIGDFVHIAPGVTMSGNVTIGEGSIIGTGASIIHDKTVGRNCVVGAGAVVVDNILEPGTYIGVPAIKLKNIVV
jgi:sugar O-acyltransferase (sialic acid O-acetyltransferase NeuD family)